MLGKILEEEIESYTLSQTPSQTVSFEDPGVLKISRIVKKGKTRGFLFVRYYFFTISFPYLM